MSHQNVDHVLANTMDASDAPGFQDEDADLKEMLSKLEDLRTKDLPASVAKKLDKATSAYDLYRQDELSRSDIERTLKEVRSDPEVEAVMKNHAKN